MNRPAYDMRWSFSDKLGAVLVILGIIGTALWLCLPSSLFIRPVSLQVAGDNVRFVRELPFGTVDAVWRSEITLIDGDGYECNSGDWQEATYQEIAGNTVTYRLGDWAERCLDAGPPFYLMTKRRVMLFGVIPLRASVDLTEVEGERPPGPVVFTPEGG
ncbi:hypothetical protein ROJ8625_04087 [Roseivivax jejudonensis]|uniref:DUF1850 domain-containing protein n=1 Tax=Roseivivax jejudonensis TaxID=1529041 RepID=A0A1X7ABE4_9RHOB|nr:hypothetical protein [Roseivivax jejudonensis]SLN74723.1 hypothetical protein ROJ8625_04087 [Roseivivax jejudonensis]